MEDSFAVKEEPEDFDEGVTVVKQEVHDHLLERLEEVESESPYIKKEFEFINCDSLKTTLDTDEKKPKIEKSLTDLELVEKIQRKKLERRRAISRESTRKHREKKRLFDVKKEIPGASLVDPLLTITEPNIPIVNTVNLSGSENNCVASSTHKVVKTDETNLVLLCKKRIRQRMIEQQREKWREYSKKYRDKKRRKIDDTQIPDPLLAVDDRYSVSDSVTNWSESSLEADEQGRVLLLEELEDDTDKEQDVIERRKEKGREYSRRYREKKRLARIKKNELARIKKNEMKKIKIEIDTT